MRKHGPALTTSWLLLRLLMVAAWGFNLAALGGTILRSWKNGDPGHVLGIGFLFLWMLFLGWVGLRTVVWFHRSPRHPAGATTQANQAPVRRDSIATLSLMTGAVRAAPPVPLPAPAPAYGRQQGGPAKLAA